MTQMTLSEADIVLLRKALETHQTELMEYEIRHPRVDPQMPEKLNACSLLIGRLANINNPLETRP